MALVSSSNSNSDSNSNSFYFSPVLPWKVRFSLFFLSFFINASRRRNGTVNRRLFSLVDPQSKPNPNAAVNGVTSSDVTVDPSRNLWFRLFTPTSSSLPSSPLPLLVYFHGGGFSLFSASSAVYDGVCRSFSRSTPAVVVSVNYRLAPEHRYPSQYDDGFDVVKFLDENDAVLPSVADVSKCFLAGDSAGANLAHHVAVRVGKSGLRNLKVIGLVSIQPFFGGEARSESEIRLDRISWLTLKVTDWFWESFLPDGLNRDHGSINVCDLKFKVDITNIDFPNTIVFLSELDLLKDRGKEYYEWLKEYGKKVKLIEYQNTIHAFYFCPELPQYSLLISQVKDFVNKGL